MPHIYTAVRQAGFCLLTVQCAVFPGYGADNSFLVAFLHEVEMNVLLCSGFVIEFGEDTIVL